jgi:hypothetical protein
MMNRFAANDELFYPVERIGPYQVRIAREVLWNVSNEGIERLSAGQPQGCKDQRLLERASLFMINKFKHIAAAEFDHETIRLSTTWDEGHSIDAVETWTIGRGNALRLIVSMQFDYTIINRLWLASLFISDIPDSVTLTQYFAVREKLLQHLDLRMRIQELPDLTD